MRSDLGNGLPLLPKPTGSKRVAYHRILIARYPSAGNHEVRSKIVRTGTRTWMTWPQVPYEYSSAT
eukprot:scaffold27317_cov22-Prasinocladus_malaysianus.AAC.1